tara:strand:+ start:104 stop:583 length:480 start_codon:yes stop_codon:yes gene_type:complete
MSARTPPSAPPSAAPGTGSRLDVVLRAGLARNEHREEFDGADTDSAYGYLQMVKYAQQFFYAAVAYNKNKNDYKAEAKARNNYGFLIRKLVKYKYVTEDAAPSFETAIKAVRVHRKANPNSKIAAAASLLRAMMAGDGLKVVKGKRDMTVDNDSGDDSE